MRHPSKVANMLAICDKSLRFLQDIGLSKSKIKPFISNFDIDMNEYIPETGRGEETLIQLLINFYQTL